MKKFVLLVVFGISSYTSNAQPEDFLFIMEEWYLNSLTINGEDYPIPFNTEVSNATIHFNEATPYMFVAKVCDELSGEIMYPSSFTFLFPLPLTLSGDSCSQPVNQDFENVFFNFFSSELEFEYQTAVVDPDPPNYYIFITDDNGNEAIFTEQPRTLSVETTIKESFTVFPNPVSQTLFIDTNLQSEFKLKILSIQGTVLIENVGTSISLESFSKGVYFLEIITSEGTVQVEKIVKQ